MPPKAFLANNPNKKPHKIMLSQNPKYQLSKEKDGVRIYILKNIAETHATRYVEIINQQIYSDSGADKDVLDKTMDAIINICNEEKNSKTIKTDIAALANSIKYRLRYPVDQHCAMRMGCLCSYYEEDIIDPDGNKTTISETTDSFDGYWLQKKQFLALNDPEWYAFFLTWGIANTPTYKEHLDTLTDMDYFLKRAEMIKSFGDYNLPKT